MEEIQYRRTNAEIQRRGSIERLLCNLILMSKTHAKEKISDDWTQTSTDSTEEELS